MREIRILVADDDEDVCQLLREYLSSLGGRLDLAPDGKRAMEFLESREYDCVFLDCNMPEVTGLEVAKYLSVRTPRPKIVMMTGYNPMNEKFATAEGIDVYLKKPIMLSEVRTLIEGIGRE